MDLNMHILYYDFKDLEPQKRIHDDCLTYKLRFVSFYEDGTIPSSDRLYVVTADQLATVPSGYLSGSPSFFCVGTPPEDLLRGSSCNIVWTCRDITTEELAARLNERFYFYNRWHLDLERALNRNKPLRRLGELSSDVFNRPIWVWDQFYETIFHVVDRHRYRLPDNYVTHEDHTPWPLWELDAWKEGDARGLIDIQDLLTLSEPYTLPSSEWFDYRSLCSNIFIGDEYVATVSLDEVGETVTERDYALLQFFCGVLSSGIKRDLSINMSVTVAVYARIRDLLNGKQVSASDLSAALETISWKIDDPMVCLVAEPMNPFYSDSLLSQTAEKISGQFTGVIYTIYEHSIVFIINLRIEQDSNRTVIDDIMFRLQERKCQTKLGVSIAFEDFSNLFMYYMEAVKALEYGRRSEPGNTEIKYYRYDDFIIYSIVENICDHAIPEIVCPTGLMHLRRFDQDNDTQLCEILRVYLENEMHVAETARELYMHRNTLLNKLKKISSVLDMDLDNPDNRFVLQLAFRVMQGATTIRPIEKSNHPVSADDDGRDDLSSDDEFPDSIETLDDIREQRTATGKANGDHRPRD